MKNDKKMAAVLRRLAAAGLAGGMLWCGVTQASAATATLKDVFDEHYYADTYEDLKEKYGYDREALWNHYLEHGLAEGRPMNELFDVKKYREQYADLNAAFGEDWDAYISHYLTVGAKEGRDNGTGNEFNAFDYAARYSDLQAAYGDDVLGLWKHYRTSGAEEGREARSEEVLEAEREAEAEAEREAAEKAEAEQKPEEPEKPEATQKPEPYVPKGNELYSGEWNGLSWLVTDAGELVVTGHMEDPKPEEGNLKDKNGNITGWDWRNAAPWNEYKKQITRAYMDFTGAESLRRFFSSYTELEEVNLSNLDTGSVTDMSYMFYFCYKLSSLDLSSFDTGNVTNMSHMFDSCAASSLDLSSFDTSNVTNMSSMFAFCAASSLDLSSFDTSNVTNMSYMFYTCSKLSSLDLSSFNTSNIKFDGPGSGLWLMFAYSSKLKEILVGEGWRGYNSTMFEQCGVSELTRK